MTIITNTSNLTLTEARASLKKGTTLAKEGKYLEAIELHKQLAAFFEEAEDWINYVRCLYRIGIIYNRPKRNFPLARKEQLAKAKTILHKAVAIGTEKLGPNHLITARALYNLTSTYSFLGNYYKSKIYNEALWNTQLAILGHDHSFLESIYHSLLLNNKKLYEHEPNKLLAYYQQWLPIFEEDTEKYATYLAMLYDDLGGLFRNKNHRRALAYYQKSLALHQAIYTEQPKNMIRIYGSLAAFYYEQQDSKLALSYFQKAIDIALQTPDNNLSVYALPILYMNLANCYKQIGDIKQSLFFYYRAIILGKEILGEEGSDLQYVYRGTASCYFKTKNWAKALSYNQQALRLYEVNQLNKPTELYLIYTNFGTIYLNTQQAAQALTYYQKALETVLAVFGKQNSDTIDTHLSLQAYHLLQKNYPQAFHHIQEALVGCFEETNHFPSHYYCPSNKDTVLKPSLFKVLQVRAHFFRQYYLHHSQNLLDLQLAIFSAQIASRTLDDLRREYQMQGSKISMAGKANELYKQGLLALQLAIPILENQPIAFAKSGNKLTQINQDTYPKDSFNYCYTMQDCYDLAFSFSEKGKGMALLDKIKDKDAKLGADIPKALLDKEADLQADLLYYEREIKQAEAKLKTMEAGKEKDEQDEYLTKIQAKHFDCYQKLKPVMEQLENEYPDYHCLKYKEDTASIAQLQDALTEQQAIISYFVATPTQSNLPIAHDETPIFIFCITQHSFEFYRIEKPDDFNKKVKNLLKTINRMRYKKYVQAAHDLYQILIEPIVEQLNKQNIEDIIIIPHDNLSGVPFEALLTDAAENLAVGSYSELPYLIQQYNISYHYSATLFYQSVLKEKEPKGELANGFVGFAPVYTDQAPAPSTESTTELSSEQQAEMDKMVEEGIIPAEKSEQDLVIADFELLANPMALRGATRDIEIDGEKYAALLFSEEEIKGIEELLAEKGVEVQTFLHEQATMQRFKEAVKGKKYIHIAAHGYDHIVQKDLTGIIFSPDENTKKQSDTILFLTDTYGLKLDADLVVLSSCKSGIGAIAKGEGMIAMNRGFLYAGAKNVMYTLFKIYDKASSELTQQFFNQAIVQQKTFSKALQLAKRGMIAQSNYTPKHWAGFVLIGK